MKITAHNLIDAQLEAYRNRDLEKFVSYYSESIKIHRNDTIVASGIEDLRALYKDLFDLSPDLTIRIANRRIEQDIIHDTELITGLRGNPNQITAHVRYKVNEGKIVEVWIAL